jgi:hypothetical protein
VIPKQKEEENEVRNFRFHAAVNKSRDGSSAGLGAERSGF